VRALREKRHAPWTLVVVSGMAAALALPGAGGAGPSQQADALTKQQAALGSRAHAVLMSLYALEAGLVQARSTLAALGSQLAEARAAKKRVARDREIAARAWHDSVEALGAQLRAMYETSDDESALAVVFAASSIDDAVARLDAMRWSARLNRQTIEQTRTARLTLARLETQLAARVDRLRGLQAQAAATAAALASTRAARVAYVAGLTRQRTLNARQITRLRTAARTIAQRSQAVAAEQQDAPTAPSLPQPVVPGRTLTVTATGYSLAGHTSTGMPVGWGVVAVDPSLIPLGTRLTIPGYGQGVAADTGGAVQGASIDLWFPTPAQALAWGRRTVTVTLH
jgi:3D (Asp-Asp-Asp) domain-containing protein